MCQREISLLGTTARRVGVGDLPQAGVRREKNSRLSVKGEAEYFTDVSLAARENARITLRARARYTGVSPTTRRDRVKSVK